jgi:hypothetical protein
LKATVTSPSTEDGIDFRIVPKREKIIYAGTCVAGGIPPPFVNPVTQARAKSESPELIHPFFYEISTYRTCRRDDTDHG